MPPRSLVVATDLGEPSARALAWARAIHERHGTAVRLLHAEHLELPPYFRVEQASRLLGELRRERDAGARYLADAAAGALGFRPQVTIVEAHPVDAILEAGRHADLVVMASHGRRGLARLWAGSVTERVIAETRGPVLVIPPAAAPPALGAEWPPAAGVQIVSDREAALRGLRAPLTFAVLFVPEKEQP